MGERVPSKLTEAGLSQATEKLCKVVAKGPTGFELANADWLVSE